MIWELIDGQKKKPATCYRECYISTVNEHTCSPSTVGVKAGGLGRQDHSQLHGKFMATMSYRRLFQTLVCVHAHTTHTHTHTHFTGARNKTHLALSILAAFWCEALTSVAYLQSFIVATRYNVLQDHFAELRGVWQKSTLGPRENSPLAVV